MSHVKQLIEAELAGRRLSRSRRRAMRAQLYIDLADEIAAEREHRPTKRERARCGARTRQGRPCQATALDCGRCRLHGGLSSGPKTAEGKAKIAAAQRARWAAYRQKHAE
jgi:hypothetical protein